MRTLDQIAMVYGYTMLTVMILFALWLWRAMKKAPTFDETEENRVMGLMDRITELEGIKENLTLWIERDESKARLYEKENEDLKGELLVAKAKQSAAEINLATANIQVIGMRNALGTAYDQHAALLTKHEQLKKENETLKQDNKITVEALFQKEADITTARKRASLLTARLTDLLAKEDYQAILELANNAVEVA